MLTKMIPWEYPHSLFVLCFTRFEAMSGCGTSLILLFHCVLTASSSSQGNKIQLAPFEILRVCIVFYTL